MNRIDKLFIDLKNKDKKALVGFLVAGDPDITTTYNCILKMQQEGCDLIEVGIPFSDPCAEGSVIQSASSRALANGITTDEIFMLIKRVREVSDIPLVFLLYYNQVFKYGINEFIVECKNCGIDGLIIPDLAYEHHDELKPYLIAQDLHLISLVTPVSKERKKDITLESKGFLYCVTSLGVTGVRETFDLDLKTYLKELDSYSNIPKLLGFGISTPEQVSQLVKYCDGVIVGSAIVKIISGIQEGTSTLEDLGLYINSLRIACDSY